MDRQPPTDVLRAITWWAAVLEDVTLQEGGLEVHLPVKVCCISSINNATMYMVYFSFQQLWTVVL